MNSYAMVVPPDEYVSPGLRPLWPAEFFPCLWAAEPRTVRASWLRSDIRHICYVDRREPAMPLLSRDEAHLLYNNALLYQGQAALQLGAGRGWSTFFLASAGPQVQVLDPLLARADYHAAVSEPLTAAGIMNRANLVAADGAADIEAAAVRQQSPFSFFFLDRNPTGPLPLDIIQACEARAAPNAMMLFNNLVIPAVADGWKWLQSKGWQLRAYQTRQMMGVAWRGTAAPVEHWPDPSILWSILWDVPAHLQGIPISGWHNGIYGKFLADEFNYLQNSVRSYTLLCQRRLSGLYTFVRQVCLADLPGNIVECGTCWGGAAAFMARITKQYSRRPRTTFACDTFEGMPRPSEFDKHQGVPANETPWGEGTIAAPVEVYLATISKQLQVQDRIVPIKGLFADTLPRHKAEFGPIAVLHVDADWYESTLQVLHHLYDQVLPGGFIQFDDYEHWEGCKKAIHEFERERGLRFCLNPLERRAVWLRKPI
jgi:predicted O-methyltransferase YrrM